MKYLSLCECGKNYPGDMRNCPHCGAPEWASSQAHVNPRDYGYDLETYPNCFTMRVIHIATDTRWRFEISEFVDDSVALIAFVMQLKACNARGVGYNNVGFDYPVLHRIVMGQMNDPRAIYDLAMQIIRGGDKFAHVIWDNDRIFEQIDLYKIRHFDNVARATSLKSLEIAMRMDNVDDLPFPVGTVLNREQIEALHAYNEHDVIATIFFYVRTLAEIEFREVLTKRYDRNFMNHNDTKIGKDYFIMELERNGVECFEKINGKRYPRQTLRPSIKLGDVIFPYVKLEHPEFRQIHETLAAKTITETKGSIKDLTCVVGGVTYKFGTGGLHSAIDNSSWQSNDDYIIILEDVTSYYPSLAIVNKVYPEHLGVKFCDIYEDMFNQRKSHKKGTPENAMLKLALNGTYGDSNNIYSPFYDPAFTMCITLNGQFLLCMLVEQLIKIPGLIMVQTNTDGIVAYCPRKYESHFDAVCEWWQNQTCLGLEKITASALYQRDVNNYICVED